MKPGGWLDYPPLIESTGADALELNLYRLAFDRSLTGQEVERESVAVVREVRRAVRLPLAVKLSPFYSSFANFAIQIDEAGADGLVLFNRFYQPDLDLDTFDVVTKVSLSHPSELRMPLRWIAILRPQLGVGTGLAATTGVHGATDAIKALAEGADVVMMASAILRHGAGHVGTVTRELIDWMEEREYESVSQLRGSASAATVAAGECPAIAPVSPRQKSTYV